MSKGGFRELIRADAPALARLLQSQRAEYVAWFHPFAFDERTIASHLESAIRDRYWALESEGKLVGFFMLRGFDAGYQRPSYGVFVAEEAAGRGLARASLDYALHWCATCGIETVMLKVAAENDRARAVYESAGFVSVGTCASTGQHILEKRVSLTANS
jgi:RimJ/RimL family protein N-acetyltransferase